VAVTVTTEATVRIAFTVLDDGEDRFQDALYFPIGQVPAPAVIRTMALERYQAWRAIVRPPPHIPTLAEKVALYRMRRDERLRLEAELANEDPTVVAAAEG